jgi:hypothetical protein
LSIKTRIEKLEDKVKPKLKRKPLRIRFIFGDKNLSTEELAKSMKLTFDDTDMIMRMPRPGQADAEDAGPDVLTVRIVDPKAQDQVGTVTNKQDQGAKQDPQPEQEPSDDELEAEIRKLEQRKAVLQREGKK